MYAGVSLLLPDQFGMFHVLIMGMLAQLTGTLCLFMLLCGKVEIVDTCESLNVDLLQL